MRKMIISSLLIAVIVLGIVTHTTRAANAVVGSGTPASCTETTFDAALATVQGSGGGTLTFNCGGVKTITLTNQKSIVANLTLQGANLITLSGGNSTRLFFINGGVTFLARQITLSNGNSPVGGGLVESAGAYLIFDQATLRNSAAISQGGAIYCYVGTGGTLTINNSLFYNNTSQRGNALYNDGCAATISNSTFSDNINFASSANGGAIYHTGSSMTITGSTFRNNRALDGGALYIDIGATATLTGVTFQQNNAGYGGGIENNGTLIITASTFANNTVTGSGGGLWQLDAAASSDIHETTFRSNTAYEGGAISIYGGHGTLQNVAINDNKATGGNGGGIQHIGDTLFMTNITFAGNRALGVYGRGGGLYQHSAGNLTLTNATIANNQANYFGGGFYHHNRYAILTNVTFGNNTSTIGAGHAIYEESPMTVTQPGVIQIRNSAIFGDANNCDGPLFDSLGYNRVAGGCSSLSQPTDQTGLATLQLGSLGYNGGFFSMQTYLPLPGSPLRNSGNAADCLSKDQRGAARVGQCDIGAVESGAILPMSWLPLVRR